MTWEDGNHMTRTITAVLFIVCSILNDLARTTFKMLAEERGPAKYTSLLRYESTPICK
jgi:hypothetical protein